LDAIKEQLSDIEIEIGDEKKKIYELLEEAEI